MNQTPTLTLTRQAHRLLQVGMALIILASLEGFVIPALASPRIGLSVLGALQSVFLLALGLLWPRLRLGARAPAIAFWTLIYSTLAILAAYVTLHDYAGGVVRTRLVSAADIAHALARELDLTSGLLPPDALWWVRTSAGERVAVWRAPRVWTVRLRERYDAPPRRLRLPMPGLVFVCSPRGQAPYVFAAKARPKTPDDELYHCPTYNVFPTSRVCTGSHAFPADAVRVPEEFFRSYFSATGDTAKGKSRRHPDDVGLLWAELHGLDAYPLDDLVPATRVGDAQRIGE